MTEKSELAIKLDEWLESPEGITACDPSTLYGDTKTLLRNRLECAFISGAIANEEVKQEICEKAAKATLEPGWNT